MASKHTPGPWRVGFTDGSGTGEDGTGCYILAGDDENFVAVVEGGKDDGVPYGVVTLDDARLIALAPEMLEAIQAVFDRGECRTTQVMLYDILRKAKGNGETDRQGNAPDHRDQDAEGGASAH